MSASKQGHVPTRVQPARAATKRCELCDGALQQPLQSVQVNPELLLNQQDEELQAAQEQQPGADVSIEMSSSASEVQL